MTNPLTPEELAQMKERLEKATPGEWRVWGGDNPEYRHSHGVVFYKIPVTPCGSIVNISGVSASGDTDNMANDLSFIAHARQDVPRLIEEVERLQKLAKAMAEFIEKGEYTLSGNYNCLYYEDAAKAAKAVLGGP